MFPVLNPVSRNYPTRSYPTRKGGIGVVFHTYPHRGP